MEPLLSPALVDFIREECVISASMAITASTRLQDEFGVYGDDATDLLLAYAKAFHVDLTRFTAADYFDGEGLDVLAWFRPAKPQRKKLTVIHLQRGIEAKRLVEVII